MPQLKKELKEHIISECKRLSKEMPVLELQRLVAKRYSVSESFTRRLMVSIGLREKQMPRKAESTKESEYFSWKELRENIMVPRSYE